MTLHGWLRRLGRQPAKFWLAWTLVVLMLTSAATFTVLAFIIPERLGVWLLLAVMAPAVEFLLAIAAHHVRMSFREIGSF